MLNMISQFVRNSKNNPVGLMVAVLREDGTVGLGWSRCSKKDVFRKDRAYEIAVGRAKIKKEHPYTPEASVAHPVASTIAPELKNFRERVRKYYKDRHIDPVFSVDELETELSNSWVGIYG